MTTDEELDRAARQVLRLMLDIGGPFKAADRRRPPEALKTAAGLRHNGAAALTTVADILVAGRPSTEAWPVLVKAALLVGLSAGITHEHAQRAAGNGRKPITKRSALADEVAALAAMERAPEAKVADLAARMSITPASLLRRIRRHRKTTRTQ